MILNVQMNQKSAQVTKESLEFAQKAMIAFWKWEIIIGFRVYILNDLLWI